MVTTPARLPDISTSTSEQRGEAALSLSRLVLTSGQPSTEETWDARVRGAQGRQEYTQVLSQVDQARKLSRAQIAADARAGLA